VGLDSLGDPLYPQLGNSGYDAQHYTLDLAVNMETNVISGTATIRALATQDLDAFNLDLEGLEVGSVAVTGEQATVMRERGEMRVAPAGPLKANEEFTVVVAYRGVPEGSLLEGTPVTIGWTRYDKGVYVASEPSGASTWYPVNDHPCDKATYTMRIAVPDPYVVAANGLLKEMVEGGDTTTYVWESTQPMASYLVTVNIAEFTRQEQTSKAGVPIRNYFPARIADDVDDPFARTPEMVDYLGSIFGPYPFDAYGVVVADTNLGFALETQTLSLFGRGVATRNAEAEEVVVHELAHQWFGDSVSLESWRDIWLNEGFATYAQWLWLEQTEGRAAYNARIDEMHQVVNEEAPPPPGNPPADNLFNPGVYLRGGLTLHALRQQVGDAAFFNILKTYAERYKYGNASTNDFIALSEEVSGQKLEELFDAWLYAADMPELR
jgi:aminopeptidase N